MNLPKEVKNYASKIKVQVYDEDSLSICQRAIEINITKAFSGNVCTSENDKLLFLLFLCTCKDMNMDKHQAPFNIMNYLDNELTLIYKLACISVYEMNIDVHDVGQYRVPEHINQIRQDSKCDT